MSTAIWPPIPSDQVQKELETSQANELQWLLDSLQSTLQSLKSGLEECATLLAPSEQGSTLVLSSHRSEALKGFVTRVGTRIVKGTINLRLSTLPPPKTSNTSQASYPLTISSAPQAPTLTIPQLVAARTSINNALDAVDVSLYTGDAQNPQFIAGQLKLLADTVHEARTALKGELVPDAGVAAADGGAPTALWTRDPVEPDVFDPPLPREVAFSLRILDAGLLLEVRTLEFVESPTSGGHAGGAAGGAGGLIPFGLGLILIMFLNYLYSLQFHQTLFLIL